MAKKFIKSMIALAMAFCITASPVFAAQESMEDAEQYDVGYLESVIKMIKEKYKGEVTDRMLIEGALKGMFSTMDPYTTYFSNEEAEGFIGGIEGTYEGIGISFSREDQDPVVNEVFKGSPAEEAGILTGDIIVDVEGQPVKDKTDEEIAALIKGEEGTQVTIGIMRKGKTEVIRFEVVRRKIDMSPVSYSIEGDIGYIKLDSFTSNSSRFMEEALQEMDSKNITKIILDLRDNPGGEVSQAVGIARKFVPKGLITRLDFKSESQTDYEYHSDLQELKYKLVLLVNRMSASASEILAGAVQDTKAGILIGTKTYGKGKVQNIYPMLTPEAYEKYRYETGEGIINAYDLNGKIETDLKDDEIIGWTKITTGAYYTPNGRMIDGVGLDPDIYVENENTVNNIDVRSISKLRKTKKPTLNSDSVDVYNAEKILLLLGYEVDTPDTVMDEKTFKAVMEFQKSIGLFPYGVLDFSTQQALNDKLDELVKKIDKQYAKALEILGNQ